MEDREALRKRVEEKRDLAIDLQRELTAVPALAPQNGGTGEAEKARVLSRWITRLGEYPSFINEIWIGSRERWKWRIEARDIGAYIGGIVERQRRGDRGHDSVCPCA